MNALPLLLVSHVVGSGLFGPSAPESERLKVLSKYLKPAPGETIELDRKDLRDRGESSPFRVRGFIEVTPPPKTCFVISRAPDRPDDNVCKKTRLSFLASDLQSDGSITWRISTGKNDPGFNYSWPTPHRVGQVIPAGERPDSLYHPQLIVSCHAKTNTSRRRILLQLTGGRLWTINLPEVDQLAPQPKEAPNLFIDEIKAENPISASNAGAPREEPDHIQAKNNAHLFEHVTTYWTMPRRHAFQMPADHFHSQDAPRGINGQCRYRFSDAPNDSTSGWIECHNTAEFDVVLLPLSCSKAFL